MVSTNTISVNGCYSKKKNLIKSSVNWFINSKMKRFKNLDIQIQMANSDFEYYGFCSKIGAKSYEIFIHRDLSKEKMIETLMHEMVHVKQMAQNKLKMNKFGSFWGSVNYDNYDYEYLPWEIEAYELETLLTEQFLKYYESN